MFMVYSCVRRGGCPMGPTQSAAVANYGALSSRLASSPLTGPSGGVLADQVLISSLTPAAGTTCHDQNPLVAGLSFAVTG